MPIRLLDPDETKIIEVSGTKFHIRPLTIAKQQKVAAATGADLLDTDIDRIIPPLSYGIVKIEGFEDHSVIEVLINLASIADFWRIYTEILKISTLSDDETKNSESSPEASSTIPAGNADENVSEEDAPVYADQLEYRTEDRELKPQGKD